MNLCDSPGLMNLKEPQGIKRNRTGYGSRRARGPLGWDLVESEFSVGPYVDQATIGFHVIHFYRWNDSLMSPNFVWFTFYHWIFVRFTFSLSLGFM